jgi:hypothetical protein
VNGTTDVNNHENEFPRKYNQTGYIDERENGENEDGENGQTTES